MSIVASQAEYDQRYPTVPLERWRNNVVEAVAMIGDYEHQATNWFREDRPAWEHPDELICGLFDDSNFELFQTDCDFSLSDLQRLAVQEFSTKMNRFLANAPQSLDPLETFRDPLWEEIRISARNLVSTFSA